VASPKWTSRSPPASTRWPERRDGRAQDGITTRDALFVLTLDEGDHGGALRSRRRARSTRITDAAEPITVNMADGAAESVLDVASSDQDRSPPGAPADPAARGRRR
jgi:hypothetical protein